MKKMAIVAAMLLVAFCGCKKDEPEQEQPQPEYLTADFKAKVGYYLSAYESVGGISFNRRQDPLGVVVYDLSTKAESYLWEWGDGESTRGKIEWTGYHVYDEEDCKTCYGNTHLYSEPGTYTITLTVSNGDGETDVKCKTIDIL